MEVLTSSRTHTKHDDMVKMYQDPAYFDINILPNHFWKPLAEVHFRMQRAIHSTVPFVNIIVPREFGKTTVVNCGFPLYNICFGLERFIVMCSETATEAESNLRTVKYELVTNDRIKHYWGDLKVDRVKDEFGKWNEKYAKTSTGIYLAAKGAGSQIRGIKAINVRPTLIIVDDPQGIRTILTEQTLNKMDTWLENEVIFARATKYQRKVGGKTKTFHGKVRLLGTVVHHECLVNRKRKDSRFTTVFMQAIEHDKDGNRISLWPEMFSLNSLDKQRAEYKANGKEKVWMQEKMNVPMSEEDKPFDKNRIKYWDNVVDGGNSYFDIYHGVPVLTFSNPCVGLTEGMDSV
ncbi:hypothetical protein LCGC14_0352020 [marine sediment metagenome]|uniref:Terminase large subunit gp17-like C-terminal domain-containing protein n=1 Tax=marine sediment metagenome TaxID=412755 RepID=A0A0F9WIU6_9ZZZZ